MNDLAVTLEHIRKAAEWAQACLDQGFNPTRPVGGHLRRYNQNTWDCGTACCIWGAAHLLATGQPAPTGPGHLWASQSPLHGKVWHLLIQPTALPFEVLYLLDQGG